MVAVPREGEPLADVSRRDEERTYKCRCGGFLLKSALTWGVVKDVYCRSCRRRQDIYLGGAGGPRLAESTATLDRTKGQRLESEQ